jgi:DNA-binding XRE family transcriptional regulator
LQNANDERRILKLFRNLEAEQARFGLTNQKMAEKLGISRVSYENKKKTGKFTACEAKILCQIFSVKFEYLFKTE